MKKGWQTKTLGEIGKVSMCKRIFKEETTAIGDIPFYKIGTFGKEPDAFIPNQTYNEYRAKYSFPKKGDVLISASGTIGRRLRYGGEPAYFQDSNIVWIDNDEQQVLNDYLYHFYGACEWNSTKGATISRLYNDNLRRIAIGFPKSLPEQQRIVGLLDEAFEGLATAKANAEKNLQNARALFESHLQSVFTQRGPGWVEKPLGDLCDFLNGFAFKSGDAVVESQTQLVRMGNLYGNQLDLDRSPVFYPDSFSTEHSRYVLEEGDIIMSLTGTTGKEDYGFAVRIPDCGLTLLMNQRIMKFDALKRDIIDDGYLLHYLRSRCFLDVLYPTANGTRQANLSSVTIKLLPVPLRSLKEQKAIATKLDDLREETQRLARIYERKLAALAELKKSLLHLAFTGEL